MNLMNLMSKNHNISEEIKFNGDRKTASMSPNYYKFLGI